jgi:hypothetical protein
MKHFQNKTSSLINKSNTSVKKQMLRPIKTRIREEILLSFYKPVNTRFISRSPPLRRAASLKISVFLPSGCPFLLLEFVILEINGRRLVP